MTTYIALLRGVNVAGQRMVAMSDLRAFLTKLDFEDPQSLLQSGNLVFRTGSRASAGLERLLELQAEKLLGLSTEFFVRAAEEWGAVIEQNPFPKVALRDPQRLIVQFLRNAPLEKDVRALQAAITGPEVVRARGRHAYITYPEGQGRSRLTNTMLEKAFGRGTARNWNTVRKLAALAQP